MILHCPECRARHVDAGEFAMKPHHTHACQGCGFVWRPAIIPTVGVQFLPGLKDEKSPAAAPSATKASGGTLTVYPTAKAAYADEVERMRSSPTTERCRAARDRDLALVGAALEAAAQRICPNCQRGLDLYPLDDAGHHGQYRCSGVAIRAIDPAAIVAEVDRG